MTLVNRSSSSRSNYEGERRTFRLRLLVRGDLPDARRCSCPRLSSVDARRVRWCSLVVDRAWWGSDRSYIVGRAATHTECHRVSTVHEWFSRRDLDVFFVETNLNGAIPLASGEIWKNCTKEKTKIFHFFHFWSFINRRNSKWKEKISSE